MTQFLPRKAYISSDWYSREENELFSQCWQFAALASDIMEVGDFVTVELGLYPVVILRLGDGELRAYHNVCRHRGAILLEGQGNIGKSIVCPYHRWTYLLDGRLKGAPNMASCFPNIDRNSLSLKPAGLGIFNGLLFVNPDPETDFDQYTKSIAKKAWPHDLDAKDVKEAAPLVYDLMCDWKIFVENGIDGYHLAYLHENTLGGPTPDQNIWERHSDHMIWYATDEVGVRHSIPAKSRKEASAMWAKPIKSAQTPGYGGVYYLFPNTIVTSTPYSFSIARVVPVGPGRSKLHVRYFVGPGQGKDDRKYIAGFDPKTGIISSKNWKKHPLKTNDFQTEDVWICEKIQKGMKSPAFELGPLSVGAGAEDPIRWFHSSIAKRMSW